MPSSTTGVFAARFSYVVDIRFVLQMLNRYRLVIIKLNLSTSHGHVTVTENPYCSAW